jgi:hypothetical protein
MPPPVTDIWFRSELPLEAIAQRLGLHDIDEDAENYWEWVIGQRGETEINIARTHTRPPHLVETRVSLATFSAMPESLVTGLVRDLQVFVPGIVFCGRWRFREGNEFDLEVVHEFTQSVGKRSGP